MNCVYLLQCSDSSYYCGWTNNIDRRLKAHNNGTGCKYTSARNPVKLVYIEFFSSKQDAMSREWHIKRLTRLQKEKLIHSDINQLSPFVDTVP